MRPVRCDARRPESALGIRRGARRRPGRRVRARRARRGAGHRRSGRGCGTAGRGAAQGRGAASVPAGAGGSSATRAPPGARRRPATGAPSRAGRAPTPGAPRSIAGRRRDAGSHQPAGVCPSRRSAALRARARAGRRAAGATPLRRCGRPWLRLLRRLRLLGLMRAFPICAAAMAALVLTTPGPVMASESGTPLPAVLARLDQARVHDRAALRTAGSRAAQARVAGRLARAHLAAAEDLRPGAGNSPLIAELSGAGRAYQALADAATGDSPARYAAAAAAVRRADAQLAAAVARPAPAAARVQRPASRGPALPVLVVLLGAAAAGAGALLRRRRRSAPDPRRAEVPARGPWRPRTCLTPLVPPAPAPTPPARPGSDASRRWDGAARSASARRAPAA
jgi:hypothetical protein